MNTFGAMKRKNHATNSSTSTLPHSTSPDGNEERERWRGQSPRDRQCTSALTIMAWECIATLFELFFFCNVTTNIRAVQLASCAGFCLMWRGVLVYRPSLWVTAFRNSSKRSARAPLIFCASDKLHFVDIFHQHTLPTGPFKDLFAWKDPTSDYANTLPFGLPIIPLTKWQGCLLSGSTKKSLQQSWPRFFLAIFFRWAYPVPDSFVRALYEERACLTYPRGINITHSWDRCPRIETLLKSSIYCLGI